MVGCSPPFFHVRPPYRDAIPFKYGFPWFTSWPGTEVMPPRSAVVCSSFDGDLFGFHAMLLRLLISSSSIENTRSPCSSSIRLVLTGEETARSSRLPTPVDEVCRAELGCKEVLLSCWDITDMDDWREGLAKKGETSPEPGRLPIGRRLGLDRKLSEASRRGDPT